MPDWWYTLDDIGAGGDETLRLLHEAVPAAEERDLLEEAMEAEWMDQVRVWCDFGESVAETDPADEIIALLQRSFHAVVIAEWQVPRTPLT